MFAFRMRDFLVAEFHACIEIVGAKVEYDPADMFEVVKELDDKISRSALVKRAKGQDDQAPLEPRVHTSFTCFLPVTIDSDESARRLAERSCLIVRILELWSSAPTLDQCAAGALAYTGQHWPRFSGDPQSTQFAPGATFSWNADSFASALKSKVPLYKAFADLPMWKAGKVKLKGPDHEFWILMDHGGDYTHTNKAQQRLQRVFMGRLVGSGRRGEWLKRYALNRRAYIGTTSMDPELALLVANQARARSGSLILDPFVGTASLLVASAMYGAQVMGADIDGNVLTGRNKLYKGRASPASNFAQYKMMDQLAGLIQVDLASSLSWRDVPLFDAIVCDPPYGIRAGARRTLAATPSESEADGPATRIAAAHMDEGDDANNNSCGIDNEDVNSNASTAPGATAAAVTGNGGGSSSSSAATEPVRSTLPQTYTSMYPVVAQNRDLLEFAARRLVLNGFLVFWLPTNHAFQDSDLPRHPCLELIANGEQILSRRHCRRLLTMKKVIPYDSAAHGSLNPDQLGQQDPAHAAFADTLMNRPTEHKKVKRARPAFYKKE